MKALILLVNCFFILWSQLNEPEYTQSEDKTFSIVGEWERTDTSGTGNIGKIIFYPDGTLNIMNKKRTEVRVLRYRLHTKTNPLQGEIIAAPFGLGQLKDRVPFTIRFNSVSRIDFQYTTADKIQTVYLSKVKDIPHGIIPLSR